MQQGNSGEYVFASGETFSVETLARRICNFWNVDFDEAIEIDQKEIRPLDVEYLCGCPTKAENVLGWDRKYSFNALIEDVCHGA